MRSHNAGAVVVIASHLALQSTRRIFWLRANMKMYCMHDRRGVRIVHYTDLLTLAFVSCSSMAVNAARVQTNI